MTLDDKKYPVSLNILSLETYCEEAGTELSNIETHLSSMRNMLSLFHFMMREGHRRTNQKSKFTISVEDVADVVGFAGIDIISSTIEKFMPDGEDEKKPAPQKRQPRRAPKK